MADYPDRSQLQQIIAGITEGVILIEPDQAVTYANRAALAIHGVQDLDELGRTVDTYLHNFIVRERTPQVIGGRSPIERVAAGEILEDVVVEVAHVARPTSAKITRIRSLIVTTPKGLPDCSALILSDISGHIKAEERFERMLVTREEEVETGRRRAVREHEMLRERVPLRVTPRREQGHGIVAELA